MGSWIRKGRDKGEKRVKKAAEELMQERAGRVKDALELKIPDRVPLEIAFGYFPAKYAGITARASYYDYDAWLEACRPISGPTSAACSPFSRARHSSCWIPRR